MNLSLKFRTREQDDDEYVHIERVPSGHNEASVSTYGKAGKLALGLGFLFIESIPCRREAVRTYETDSKPSLVGFFPCLILRLPEWCSTCQ